MSRFLLLLLLLAGPATEALAQAFAVSGRLMDEEGPVAFAEVAIEGGGQRVSTGPDGRFRLEVAGPGGHVLIASGMGYERLVHAFTVAGASAELGTLTMTRGATGLEEVVITGGMRPMARSESPVAVEVITPALFRKNPSPTLFDAVGMVNGVRPQINCSVCNTGDIHINGM